MRSSITILIFLVVNTAGIAQSQGSLEQYFYKYRESNSLVPIAQFQNSKNWYAEARYNYEDLNTFSLYGGKTFSRSSKLSYDITPIVGGVIGKMNGVSVGLNMDADYADFFFSSQSQYTVSSDTRFDNFFFSWSELGYQPLKWMYAGIAMQQTNLYQTTGSFEPGIFVGFTHKKWSFPIYSFSPMNAASRYFIVGINWEWETSKKESKKAIVAQ